MGYRSDVCVMFYTRNQTALSTAALQLWFDENFPREEARAWEAMIEYEDDYVCVTYNDVKWYSTYDHVEAVNLAIKNFEECFDTEDSDNAAWEMCEVGEEMKDISTRRSPYGDWRMGVRRQIFIS